MYVTVAQMIARFGETELRQLSDRAIPPSGQIDEAVVQAAIDDAGAFVDSYLAKAAQLPLAEPSPVLTRISADIARYYLHGRRAEKDDPVSIAWSAAVAWLRDAARGLVSLNGPDGIAPPRGADTITIEGSPRVFTHDTMKGF